MAEWATLKLDQGLRSRISFESAFLPLVLGGFLARGSIFGLYPFGVAFGAALVLRGERGFFFGLLGILMGLISLNDVTFALQGVAMLAALMVIAPYLRKRKHQGICLVIATTLLMAIVSSLAISFSDPNLFAFLIVALQGVLTGGCAIIFWFALCHQEAIWRGEFQREQGIAWLFILIGVISGLQGVQIKGVNFSIVLLSFFTLFISERYGAGTAAGVGALLGFMPQLSVNAQNLMDAGIYGLAGFCTGAFRRFGKLGIGTAFLSVMLMLTVFLREEAIYSQLISSAIGLFLFLLWPGATPKKDFLKPKVIPEVETTVSKVKALSEIFDQIALSYQAAEAESFEIRPEVPELMNVLVERVCHACPTMDVCWKREFYKTYHILFELFGLVEEQTDIKLQSLPIEWKRHCGRLKEMLLGAQFIMEQEKNQETWRRRLLLNQEALSRQFLNVSQVIGNLAKELHTQHNWEVVKPSNLARRRRYFLDVGLTAFTKTGNGMSGDNYASIAYSNKEHAFILSDGMGVGENAAKMSATALTLLEQLLTTGFQPEGAIQALNSILVLRSPEESFVTIDMAILDLESTCVKLIKAGASPSYLMSTEGVKKIESSSLPVGILNQIDIPVVEIEMESGEALILLTDGVQDVLKDSVDWIKEFLEKTSIDKSQEVADLIGQEVRRLSGGTLEDDGIVMVIRKNYWSD
ncbi:Stage II sporulation protein E (SpoIIE) [Desulfosporosinus orientis DSM 765]|uniref:Stage II sporulation protein E (SpoIIE) n=1 Tax=Desulfosporosinus orientis (strain ATCC 19365 / DSM 765 / NCIMB 8382 / VKM B-1628 / Singapore I) TaxID=768706 RepID=G7W7G0_DESOD|nr:SpoIIE family protein phosphatase [Desulfosporosinus orientis]AET65831.1 Stage II sporulation protein E (SpoIIE) [Desulfosporosinus orientis DSM 765]